MESQLSHQFLRKVFPVPACFGYLALYFHSTLDFLYPWTCFNAISCLIICIFWWIEISGRSILRLGWRSKIDTKEKIERITEYLKLIKYLKLNRLIFTQYIWSYIFSWHWQQISKIDIAIVFDFIVEETKIQGD